VMMIISMGFQILPKTKDIWSTIEYFLFFAPPYSFSMGILNFTMIVVLSRAN